MAVIVISQILLVAISLTGILHIVAISTGRFIRFPYGNPTQYVNTVDTNKIIKTHYDVVTKNSINYFKHVHKVTKIAKRHNLTYPYLHRTIYNELE